MRSQPARPPWLGTLGLGSLLVLACALWAGHGSCSQAPQTAGLAPQDPDALSADHRIQELLEPCAQSHFYDRDLSDIVPVLLEKLERARPEPLKRAKEELGLLGEDVFPELANLFHSSYTDPMRSGSLENTVDALSFNATDAAHELLLEALNHAQESVRLKALDGLKRNPRAVDFTTLRDRLGLEGSELRRHIVGTMFLADAARAEDFLLEAIAAGVERDLWSTAVPSLASPHGADTPVRCGQLYPTLDPPLSSYLAAGAAKGGDEDALTFLRGELTVPDAQRRLGAQLALQRAGFLDELRGMLLEDPSSELRSLAAAAFQDAELTNARRLWLRTALADPSSTVQAEALTILCKNSDEEGLARALAQLDGAPNLLQQSLQALWEPLRSTPHLAADAQGRLFDRYSLEEHRPLAQRATTFKAIGQMPTREAAEFLHRIGQLAGDEPIESLRAHEWLMIQASNTGTEGRGYLAQALKEESDPARRLDLIDAVAAARDDLARETLLALVEREARSEFERLFAANALIRVGPSWEIAPRLKRVAYAMQAPVAAPARGALQCLLWQWY